MHTRIYLAIALAFAQSAVGAATLGEITERALAANPDVRAKLYEFLSATHDQEAARGDLRPRIDLDSFYGRERLENPGFNAEYFNNPGVILQLHQLLFDGFGTTSEIRRLGYARATRYYELLATTDDTALEVARAYIDVQRYRQLIELAQDNWGTHKEIYDQIEERVRAGVGRRVDLEQAAGRLALAQSNWLTESSNLHDVGARFERVVGEPPPVLADVPQVTNQLPQEKEVLVTAINDNPNYLAAVSNLRSAGAQTDVRRAAYAPTIEFHASHDVERNRQGLPGTYRDSVAQITLNYNLFRGGSDQARIRSAQDLYNAAAEMRDKSCRDVRQTTVIAWDDLRKLHEQIRYLEQHQLSTEKARDAYRQQFDIGQRTLLDVLDTENELFEARRALVGAQFDLTLAEYRVLAATHRLLSTLGLAASTAERPDEAIIAQDGNKDSKSLENTPVRCDTIMPTYSELDTAAVMASRPPRPVSSGTLSPITPAPMTSSSTASTPVALPPPPPASAASAPVATPPVATNTDEATTEKTVRAWASAWSARNLAAYLDFYSTDFTPLTVSDKANWKTLRAKRLNKRSISVTVENLKFKKLAADSYEIRFQQHYRSNNYNDDVPKTLTLKREGASWKIIKEVAPPQGTN
ncbi:MAG TPA: TolC family outer membrane protein [Rhodocyclaceae bacterium]|nr:TolC family outer membrane protein [Rhodocyclaceae bacterium]